MNSTRTGTRCVSTALSTTLVASLPGRSTRRSYTVTRRIRPVRSLPSSSAPAAGVEELLHGQRAAAQLRAASASQHFETVTDLLAEVVGLEGSDAGDIGEVPMTEQPDLAGREDLQRLWVHGAGPGPGCVCLVAWGSTSRQRLGEHVVEEER